ncbi:MAG: AAA family ATPase [Actinobacteria bacterium]|nr:AAA family ATPase [Actinomycetota bacterium]
MGAKFCARCGSALAAACPRCAHLNTPEAGFCVECGGPLAALARPETYTPEPLAEKIRSGRRELEGERKVITVLFADVAGFTSLAESLDPEETHEIMRRCFDLMLQEVHRYEGTVSQFLGDGMLALFGAPIAHEDHAYRAVRAALAVQTALSVYSRELADAGLDFRVRIGLNTGAVVVSRVGIDLTMDYLAVGDTVNLAARVQSLAEPGTVLLSENTYRLVEGYVVCRALGEREVKGKAEPVGLYEALRPSRWRSRVDVRAGEGLAPFVGRRPELDAMLDRFEAARAGYGQVVLVAGEAGLGKSRLLYELHSRLAGEEVTWIVGRCVSYGREISYLPIVDLLRDAFAVEEGDDADEVVRKIARITGRAGVDGDDVAVLEYLLGVEPDGGPTAAMDPQLRKARIFEAVRAFLLGYSGVRPMVIAIEDLHWIDALSTELVSYLTNAVANERMMLVLTHRPDWKQPFGVQPNFTQLDLTSLSESETAEIAGSMLGSATLPSELAELLYRKAEGNPFFVEEVTRSLLEVGSLRRSNGGYVLAGPVDQIEVPDTIQDVIMARLDRLNEEPKRAIQTAAVIGREFTARLLDRIAGLGTTSSATLGELRSVELIYERSLYPELAYMFKHALTHDVAYHSLLRGRRRALHGTVGTVIEELYAERLPEHYETLAFHFEEAQEWERAFDYLLRSGEKALASFAPGAAVDFIDRAAAIVGRQPVTVSSEQLVKLHGSRGQALWLLSRWEESAESYEQMRIATGDDEIQQGLALFQGAISLFWAHRFEDAMAAAQRAQDIGRAHDSPAIIAGALVTIEGIYSVTGDQRAASAVVREANEIAARSEVPVLEGFAAVWSGFQSHWRGDEQAASSDWQRGTSIGREHQLPDVLLWTLWTEGLALTGQGRYDEAIRSLQEHLALTERLGDRVFRCRSLNTLGWVYADLCNWELAIDHNRRGAEESRLAGDPEIIRNAELNLGDCYLALGDLEEAARWLEQVERETAQTGAWGEDWMKWRYRQHLLASLGELRLAQGRTDEAKQLALECLAAAEGSESKRNVVKALRLHAEVLRAEGAPAVEAAASRALEVAREVGNPAQIWKTLRTLGLAREDGKSALAEAIATIEGMAAGLSDRALADTLLASNELADLRGRLVGVA